MPIDKDALAECIREAIRNARKGAAAAPSQTELARRTTVTRATISNIERGGHGVTIEMLYRIADALDVRPDSLLPDLSRVRTRAGDPDTSDPSDPTTLPKQWTGALDLDV